MSMNEQELKEKIVEALEKGGRNFLKSKETKVSIYEYYADALIAAGIGDVTKLQFDNEVLKMRNFFLEGSERSTEEDRRVWISKWEEAEHRAEVAERALKDVCANVIKDEEDDIAIEPRARLLYKAYLSQAEKELAEEVKDD